MTALRPRLLAPSTSSVSRVGKYHSVASTGERPNRRARFWIGVTSPSCPRPRVAGRGELARAHVDQRQHRRRGAVVERVAEPALVGDRERRLQRGRDRRVVEERRARVGRGARVLRRDAGEHAGRPRHADAEQVEERVALLQLRQPLAHAGEPGRGERAEQPAVDQHEPREVAVAGAALEVPRRVGDRHRGAERVPAEDHLAPAAARALHDRAQVLHRQLQPPLARERDRVTGDGRKPPPCR